MLADVEGSARRAAQGKFPAVLSPAFTPFGVENLKELLADLKPGRTSK